MAALTVIYDSCVLYPASLRDFLMHLALTDLVHARWTSAIHEEWMRNLLANRPDLNRAQLERTRDLMNANVAHCLVEGYESLIAGLSLPDPDDRHVLAAAIQAGAEIIATFNLSDFPPDALGPHGIQAQHPDQFICALLDSAPLTVCSAAKTQRQMLKNPPKSADDYLATLTQVGLPQTVARLQGFIEAI